MSARVSIGLPYLLFLAGCSGQLGLGTTPGQVPDARIVPEAAKPAVITGALQLEGGRRAGTVFGLRAVAIRDQGLALRSGVLAAGYQIKLPIRPNVLPPLGVEGTADLGGGMPAFRHFEGAGVYGGATIALRMHVLGIDDAEAEYRLINPKLQAVLLSHQGVWVPPEGGPTRTLYGEWTAIFALRVVVASDLLSTGLPASPGLRPDDDSPSVKP